MRLTGGGAGLGVADPLLRLSTVTTAGTLAVPVPAPLATATGPGAATPGSPLAPASTAVRLLAAVVLRVEVSSELEAVVGAAHQASSAASVAVMLASVSRSVTVALANITGTLRGAAPLTVVVPPAALLT